MSNDIPEPVSQGSNGADDTENSRIREIANELHRLLSPHDAELREGKADGSRFDIEQRVAEQYAKSVGLSLEMYW